MSNYAGNGAFTLNKLSLTVPGSDEVIDLRAAYVDMTLHESIWEFVMSGAVAIVDSFNLKDNLLLSGNEKIEIDFNTNGNEERRIIYTGYVYKITPNNQLTDNSAGYTIHFASKMMIENVRSFVQRGFKDTASNIVRAICDEFFQEKIKPVVIERSVGIMEMTFGLVKPFEAISVALRKAKSESGGVGYLFYEDNVTVNCRSIDSMYAAPVRFWYTSGPVNAFEDVTQRNNESFNKIQSFEFLEEESFLDGALDGQLGSTSLFFDLKTKTYQIFKYDNNSWFDERKSLSSKPNRRDDIINPDYEDKVDFEISNGDLDLNECLIQSKYKKQLASKNRVRILVYGDTSVRVGDVCEAKLPNLNSAQEDNLDYTSGKFLITEIKHSLTNSQYHQTMLLEKDGFDVY